jgi:hypothetical protein
VGELLVVFGFEHCLDVDEYAAGCLVDILVEASRIRMLLGERFVSIFEVHEKATKLKPAATSIVTNPIWMPRKPADPV